MDGFKSNLKNIPQGPSYDEIFKGHEEIMEGDFQKVESGIASGVAVAEAADFASELIGLIPGIGKGVQAGIEATKAVVKVTKKAAHVANVATKATKAVRFNDVEGGIQATGDAASMGVNALKEKKEKREKSQQPSQAVATLEAQKSVIDSE